MEEIINVNKGWNTFTVKYNGTVSESNILVENLLYKFNKSGNMDYTIIKDNKVESNEFYWVDCTEAGQLIILYPESEITDSNDKILIKIDKINEKLDYIISKL